MSFRDVENYRLVDGEKIDNLPDDTQAELDGKLDDITEGSGINIDKTNPNNPVISAQIAPVLTTKGDLLSYSTEEARLPVGTNGQVVTADSNEALGVKWGDPQSGIIRTLTFQVTAPFTAGEIVDITTGNGSITGTATRIVGDTGPITDLGPNATVFNEDASLKVTDNKTVALKGDDVVWESSTSVSFARDMGIGEWFIIEDGGTTGGGPLGNTFINGNLDVVGATDLQSTLNVNGNTTLSTLDVTNVNVFGTMDVSGSAQFLAGNVKYVYTMTDFPAPISGVITLEDNMTYLVLNDLTTSDRFVMGADSGIVSLNPFAQTITFTGGGTMFTGTNVNCFIRNIRSNAPNGELYNFTGTGTELIVIENCGTDDSDRFGTFGDMRSVLIRNYTGLNFRTRGMLFSGTVLVLDINRTSMATTSTNGITFIDLGNMVTTVFGMQDLVLQGVHGGTPSIGLTGLVDSGNILAGEVGLVQQSQMVGNITALVNITTDDIRYEFRGNSANIPNTLEFGEMWIPGQETVTLTQSVITVVNDTNTGGTNIWSEVETSKFEVDSSLGRMTYKGEKPKFFVCNVTATVEKVGGGADTIAGYILLNGTPIQNSSSQTQNTNPTSITCQTGFTLNEDDYIEFAVENQDSSSNVIVNISNLIVR